MKAFSAPFMEKFDIIRFHIMELLMPVGRIEKHIPKDFIFQLTQKETDSMVSQKAIPCSDWDGRRKPPLVFIQEGSA